MINDIPKQIIDISSTIVDYARMKINKPFNPNIVFILADHLNFCIKRYEKNININLPITYDIQHLFEKEYRIGEYGLKLIQKELKIYLPKEEAAYIAMHLVNAQEQKNNTFDDTDEDLIDAVTKIIENESKIKIDKNNFSYSRFVSHMYYLLKRGRSKHLIVSSNMETYELIRKEYPQTFQCSEKVSSYLNKKLNIVLSDEEKLYLMLHINRLCTREDCNQ
jgi:beta-glucoside operon transcriptional antiterminator